MEYNVKKFNVLIERVFLDFDDTHSIGMHKTYYAFPQSIAPHPSLILQFSYYYYYTRYKKRVSRVERERVFLILEFENTSDTNTH